MSRKVGWALLLAALGVAPGQLAYAGKFMSNAFRPQPDGAHWGQRDVEEAPGLVGPWGQPVPVMAPAKAEEPSGAAYARSMLQQQYPQSVLQQVGYANGPGPACAQGACNGAYPALVPGLPVHQGPPGAVAAVGALGAGGPGGPGGPGGAMPPYGGVMRTSVRFVGPGGMKISWYAPNADGKPGFAPQFLEAPARYNFLQASIYRLKLSDIPGRPGMNLYPTLEVVPSTMKTATFLAHCAVPIVFTEEDFEQAAAGNFVVKVIYLPDPQFQDLAATGPDEVVSSRLEPGTDPIVEAKRRGSILAIIRLGGIDLEAPNTPAMDAPDPAREAMMRQMMQMKMMRPGMVPPGTLPPGMTPPGSVIPGMGTGAPAPAPKTGGTPVGKMTTTGTDLQPASYKTTGGR